MYLRVHTQDFKSNNVVLMLFSTLLKSLHDNIIHKVISEQILSLSGQEVKSSLLKCYCYCSEMYLLYLQ